MGAAVPTSPVLATERSSRRRELRVRLAAPFPCSYALVGLKKWAAEGRGGLGVVWDLSIAGARVMSESVPALGDPIALSLRLPGQVMPTFIPHAMVRWVNDSVFGVEFASLSHTAVLRLSKCVERGASGSIPPTSAASSAGRPR